MVWCSASEQVAVVPFVWHLAKVLGGADFNAVVFEGRLRCLHDA